MIYLFWCTGGSSFTYWLSVSTCNVFYCVKYLKLSLDGGVVQVIFAFDYYTGSMCYTACIWNMTIHASFEYVCLKWTYISMYMYLYICSYVGIFGYECSILNTVCISQLATYACNINPSRFTSDDCALVWLWFW